MDAVVDRRPRSWTSAGCRDLLGDYLDAVLGARVLAKVLLNDPTASDHPAAARMRAQRRRLRDLLVSPRGNRRAGKVQASCALGALEGAVLDFSDTHPVLEVDSRRRVTLRIGRHSRYLAHEEPDGSLVLVPAVVIPEHEQRLLARPDLLERFEANRQDPSRLEKRARKRQ